MIWLVLVPFVVPLFVAELYALTFVTSFLVHMWKTR